MIKLRPLAADDVAAIQNWPPYPPDFEDLDYALRSNGWLAEHQNKPDAVSILQNSMEKKLHSQFFPRRAQRMPNFASHCGQTRSGKDWEKSSRP